ncbi:oxamate carbamoyltransferase subunit AllG family protein [Streptomyces sp. NPDC004069]
MNSAPTTDAVPAFAGSTPFVHAADERALDRLAACRPRWTGMSTVRAVTGSDWLLLHAGPPFETIDDIPAPVLNSLALACVYEGWATDVEAGRGFVLGGETAFAPAQDHGVVVPLAGVASPSMAVHVVTGPPVGDAPVTDGPAAGHVRYAVVNEGQEHALRLGAADPEIPAHHHWLNGAFADWLADCLDAAGPLDLLPVIGAARAEGDDCHSRTVAGSRLLAARLRAAAPDTPNDVAAFLDAAPAFALNLWMAAAALMLSAADGTPGSSAVTRAGGNGHAFGIQVAGLPGRWFTTPAMPPRGHVEAPHTGCRAVGAIGDSAIVDLLGLGGQSLAAAPAVRAALHGYLPPDATERGAVLAGRTLSDADGTPAGLTAHAVVRTGTGPLVLLGMIEQTGRAGRIGGGVYDPPVPLFETAASALSATGSERAGPH